MNAKTCKWIIFAIIALALCGWLVRISLAHAAVVQQLREKSELREAQLETVATFKELAERVGKIRDREARERANLGAALSFTQSNGLSKQLCESFVMLSDDYSLFTTTEAGSGFFLRGDEDAKVIAYMRTLPPAAPNDRPRPEAVLEQTLESPDRRIVLPAKLHYLTAYKVETSGPPGELKLGVHVTGRDVDQFIPLCDVEDTYESVGTNGPYNEGIFKDREYEITYGWPDLAALSFVKVIQGRGIWLIASNEKFSSAQRENGQSKEVQVILVLESEGQWRLHPDYSYSRDLESAFSLEWDPQQENYLATPSRPK